MSYTALYRKWRPEKFEDVKGQDAIVTTLKNQIIRDRIGHAYLFCGTRGTGKTTVAKIVAKAVNCEAPVNGSPCGKCKSCMSVADGTSLNVIEIDAASNNGVDNIREIRDEVTYAPTEGRYKVYIIDEVHMLSTGAFNALLKTLEEPPSYVIFILATTEVHKIPVTILSRCQRYDFKRIPVDTITERLNELMEGEGIKAEDKAVRYIARAADGALRDALSLMDQCNSFYFGQTLTYDKVLEVLGAVDTGVFSELLCAVIAKDISGAVRILDEVVAQGRELTQFVIDFTWYLRNLMLVKTAEEDGDIEEVIDMSSENLKQLKREADAVDIGRIMRYIRIFSQLSGDIRYAAQKRILIEIAIVKLCKPAMETDNESILDRIRVIEEKFENGDFASMSNPAEREGGEDGEDVKAPTLQRALPEDLKRIVKEWPRIISEVTNPGRRMLGKCEISVTDDDKLVVAVFEETNFEYLNSDSSREELKGAIEETTGKAVEFNIISAGTKKEFKHKYPDLSVIKMEVDIED
ncbi:MAG: DNA polymerase III subunit gamma/tau [Lachnospiraceae bacterium]|nr:DNA polymerase III subunit gamma/tau [Lachnospiraceae bacterium]